MKKLFALLGLVTLFTVGAFAQQGNQSFGVHLNYGTDSKMFGAGVVYQYGLTDQLRLEGVFDYDFPKNKVSDFALGANVHYLFPVAADVNIYPLAGLGYYNVHWGGVEESFMGKTIKVDDGNKGYLYFNAGAGAEFNLTGNLTLPIELKYQHVNGNGQLVPSVGLKFNF